MLTIFTEIDEIKLVFRLKDIEDIVDLFESMLRVATMYETHGCYYGDI